MKEITKTDEAVFRWIQSKLSPDRSAKVSDLAELTPQDWETVVSRCSGCRDWSRLLELKPEYADQCPWEKLSGFDWSELLQKLPQFADKCGWDKLSGEDRDKLLSEQPQFSDKRPSDRTK